MEKTDEIFDFQFHEPSKLNVIPWAQIESEYRERF